VFVHIAKGTTFETTFQSSRFVHFVANISVAFIMIILNVNRRKNNYRIQKTIMSEYSMVA